VLVPNVISVDTGWLSSNQGTLNNQRGIVPLCLLDGDLDGNDTIDVAVPVIRRADEHKGIALCHAGTRLSLFGYNAMPEEPLKPGYFNLAQYLNKVEFWEMRRNKAGYDELILGQTEKSEVMLSREEADPAHRLLWHFSEP